jgi:hypothetical protein
MMVMASSTIPGRAHSRNRAIRPVHLRGAYERVETAATFASSPCVFDPSRAGLHIPNGLKRVASLVAVGAGDDAVLGGAPRSLSLWVGYLTPAIAHFPPPVTARQSKQVGHGAIVLFVSVVRCPGWLARLACHHDALTRSSLANER